MLLAAITWSLVRGILLVLVALGMLGVIISYTLKRSVDPAALLTKWIITLVLIGGLAIFAALTEPGFGTAFILPLCCVAIGVILSILWTPQIGALFAKPLTSMMDGGDEPPEPKPIYSPALAKRMNGHYQEAAELVEAQLARFPNDFEGMMMLASLKAENLNDLEHGAVLVQRICNQEGVLPNQIAGALNSLADWRLSLGQDPELARQALEQIVERLPGSEYERGARQRLAHLATTTSLVAEHDRATIELKPGIPRIGLRENTQELVPQGPTVAEQAQALLKQLAQFPDDNEAREKLARLYAEEYHKPDMAIRELEQLISRPHQPVKQVAHWIHQIADYQLKLQDNLEAATATLQRLIAMFPGSAVAEMAASRINLLKLEQRGQQKTAALTLGEYEQRLGLKPFQDPRTRQRREDRGSA